jgi:hypothetical protein
MSSIKSSVKKTLFPLVREKTLVDRADTVTFTVFLDPKSKEDKMKTTAPKFETGSVEDWLEWRKHVEGVIRDKGFSQEPKKKMQVVRLLLKGSALEDFDLIFEALKPDSNDVKETEDNYLELMKLLTLKYVPVKCAHRTRTFLREVKKPRNMSVEAFKTRIIKINGYLAYMPDYKGLNQPLTDDEIQLLFEGAMPRSWRSAIAKTGHHEDMDLLDSFQYMKMMEDEEMEDMQPKLGKTSTGGKVRSSNKSTRGSGSKQGGNKSSKSAESNSNSSASSSGGSSNKNQPAARRSARAKGPYCATCKTNEHGWHECQHNPKNQKKGNDANAISEKLKPADDKKNSKKAKSNESDSESTDSEAYLIEDAFAIDDPNSEEVHEVGQEPEPSILEPMFFFVSDDDVGNPNAVAIPVSLSELMNAPDAELYVKEKLAARTMAKEEVVDSEQTKAIEQVDEIPIIDGGDQKPAATDKECNIVTRNFAKAAEAKDEDDAIDPAKPPACYLKLALSQGAEGGQRKYKVVNALVDSGSAGTFIKRSVVPSQARVRDGEKKDWATEAGTFTTDKKATILF